MKTLAGLALCGTMIALPSGTADASSGCSRSFDEAVKQYVDTTHKRDVDGWAAVLHDQITVIFDDGEILDGKAKTVEWVRKFFADPKWTQSFKELKRVVRGCDTGFVLFDSIYAKPAENYRSHLIIGVTFTREHGRWLAIHNQDSKKPS